VNGHPDIKTPYNKSEFLAMTQRLRIHHDAMHDEIHTVAVELRKLLRDARGKSVPEKIDRAMSAIRVTRHLIHVAALNKAAGRAYEKSYRTFIELFDNPQPQRQHARGFDVDK
jgi:hypothetical protein